MHMGREVLRFSEPFSQFCCKPKTVLKNRPLKKECTYYMISFKCQDKITLISGNNSLNNSYFCKTSPKENWEKPRKQS